MIRDGDDKKRMSDEETGLRPHPARSFATRAAEPRDTPIAPGRSTIPGPQVAGGSFVVDRAGNILAFDRSMERLTGWHSHEIVGHSREFGFYDTPDELGLRRFERRTLFDGRLPQPDKTTVARLNIHTKTGGYFETEVLVTPLGPGGGRFAVEIQRILTRVSPPVGRATSSGHDPLTRLAGPDVFRQKLTELLEATHVTAQPLSLLLVDIDDFEELIERAGRHQAREVLRRTGGVIQALVRHSDVVARVKEDGFAIILAGAGRGEAREVGERIHDTVSKFSFARDGGGETRITTSIGIASHPADGDDAVELIKRCGEALSEAHRLGRNRVWCYARSARVPAHVPVYFDGPAAHLLGRSRDLSASGIFVETQEDLRVGMRLGMMFKLPGQSQPVRCVGRIARRVPAGLEGSTLPPGLGIEFERYSEPDRSRIDAHISRVKAAQNRRPT